MRLGFTLQIELFYAQLLTDLISASSSVFRILAPLHPRFIISGCRKDIPTTNEDRLRLSEEVREIETKLRLSAFPDSFVLKQEWAVRIGDLQSCLLRHQPDIVHFSGHGSPKSEIVLEDSAGKSQAVPVRALEGLFSTLKDNIRCVVLNACHSQPQATAIAQHIDCVIGMSKAINDKAAISFAASFYQALAYGRSVGEAHKLGCNQIHMENLGDEDVPCLLAPGADPNNIFFVERA